MKTLESIASDALLLPLEQRLSLAHQLLISIEPPPNPEVEKAWEEEIQRRIRAYDSGEVRGIPVTEVFAKLDKKLSK